MKENLIGIGTGIYTPSDISQILKINIKTINRWLSNYFSDKYIKTDKTKITNFYSLIELYVFNVLLEKGVKRKYLKDLYTFLLSKSDFDYPFATKKIRYLGNQVYAEHRNQIIDGQISSVIKEFIEPFLTNVEFTADGISEKYFPLGKEHFIVVDPQIQFGQPIIKNTGIKVEALMSFYNAGEKTEDIAWFYNIPIEAINDAIKFVA